jgi:hypothetical protein
VQQVLKEHKELMELQVPLELQVLKVLKVQVQQEHKALKVPTE